MIEELIKELTAAILTLNDTLKQQARASVPEPEKHEHKAPVAKGKTTAPTEPAAEPTPETPVSTEAEPTPETPVSTEAEPTATASPTVEERHKALQQLCLKLVRADPSRKARIKSIMGEYGATLVADIPEKHLSEAERRIADIGEGD